MDQDTVNTITDIVDENSHWTQKSMILDHNGVELNLCHAIGDNPTPLCSPEELLIIDQPQYFPAKCTYRFDNKKFYGKDASEMMEKTIKDMCPGCEMIRILNGKKVKDGYLFQWSCNKSIVSPVSPDTFATGKVTKTDVVRVTNKSTKSKHAWQRIHNPKIKHTRGRKPTADRRGSGTVTSHNKSKKKKTKRRSTSQRPKDKDRKCPHVVKVLLDYKDEYFLRSDSCMQHRFHGELEPETNLLNESDLDKEDMDYMKLMFDSNVAPQTIANIMSSIVNKKGKPGEFLASTIQNIGITCQAAMDAIAEVVGKSKMSEAEKTIQRLNQ